MSLKSYLFMVGLLVFASQSFACIKIFPRLKVSGASFEKQFFAVQDSKQGPVFNENGEDKMTYNTEQKKWCLGDDCEILNKEGTGSGGDSKFNIPLRDGKDGPMIGIVMHGKRPGQMLIFSVKPGADSKGNPMDAIDRSKPWVSLDPSQSDPNVLTMSVLTQNGAIGRATHRNSTLVTRGLGGDSSDKPDDKFTDLVGKEMGLRDGCSYPPIDDFGSSKGSSGDIGNK